MGAGGDRSGRGRTMVEGHRRQEEGATLCWMATGDPSGDADDVRIAAAGWLITWRERRWEARWPRPSPTRFRVAWAISEGQRKGAKDECAVGSDGSRLRPNRRGPHPLPGPPPPPLVGGVHA